MMEALVQHLINHGGSGATVRWDAIERAVLFVTDRLKSLMCNPNDELWGYDYYVGLKGAQLQTGWGTRLCEMMRMAS